ncbi:hypothetical protein A3A79_04005 [Candidatus Gottesmanbacteria bacterium RIFCSPLOWO2_01_FULL_43_11b]|uniref:Uncharacterized protein n=1 Tax=Candidatus Gottesmanbacteria bacterium RIFCSPLOWO2_01_FULL_43_11b TaxID=1798392 RepID=A0A1F6AHU6_9BACT|nr:MAG: hypothetical protein A3A79_04005 [Candidatus Gottesmanbacteria bacterium RIFCSPLOWO2_01_FULL_43_11b]
MYKAIILDLDGTVVPQGSENPPSERVTQAISAAKDIIHVCIATGRPLFASKYILDHLQLSGPCIFNNGVQVYDPEKNEIVKEFPLPQKALPNIMHIFKSHKQEILFFDGTSDVEHTLKELPDTVFSVYLNKAPEMLVDIIVGELRKIPNIEAHKMFSWEDKNYFSIEVTSDQATKLHGIVEITKILKITKEEIIGVGDSYNDFPLLMASGLKIAMGNAVPELKEIADFIAPSVDEDGVATIIEKFVLT